MVVAARSAGKIDDQCKATTTIRIVGKRRIKTKKRILLDVNQVWIK